ncbi:MAG: cyclic nucleotide-binding domain-containing protein [Deltaproteobacteria bacterium]|nr:MAG: cyclic nucleotide-binding domain-containing protein [Deltaproteobacteria bacterium]
MGGSQSTGASAPEARLPDASVAPPPLLDGIVRVKVPADKIQPFLTRSALFKSAPKDVITRVSGLLQGLECADGSEIVTAGKVNDGIGILYSGKAQVLLPSAGGELAPVEDLLPGDHFGEVGALLGKPSPYFVIASGSSRVLWLPSSVLQGMIGNVPTVAEALAKRLTERVVLFAAMERQGAPELMTDIEAQLLQTVDPAVEARPLQSIEPEPDPSGVVAFAELRDFDLSPSVLATVPTKLIRSFRLLPVKLAGNVLTVAMVNPRDNAALAELRRTLQTMQIVPVAIGLEDFNSALVRLKLLDDSGPKKSGGPRINPDSFQFETVAEQDRAADARAVGDDAIRLVNRIIAAGLEREASDIHIEPTAQGFRVRFRANGLLQDWSEPIPATTSLKGVTARIKVLAGLDITERRLPQDGRIGVTTGKREIDLRVSTLPANRGEKIALRILEAAGSTRALEQIFLEPTVLAAARKALNRPYGGIVIAGPTGSGKTSSLYALLNERKVTRPDTNIIMVEDPIEYRLAGVTQVQVNANAGLGFPQVLRSMLRQDPDVIVVGEMRDEDTARIGLEAAMTGHLLLTSLHANHAIAAVQRLENLGTGRALIAQSIHLVLVQRLVRKLCSACRKLDPPVPALLESLVARRIVDKGQQTLPRAVGCDACGGTGYVGRAAVVEALQINDAVREAIAAGRSLADVHDIATETRALTPFIDYARHLLQKQIISASEVLLSVAD